MFDMQLQAFEFSADLNESEELLTLSSMVGFLLPVGPGQAAPIAIGVVRSPINREQALKLASDLTEKADKLAPASKLVVAGANDAEQVAQFTQKLR